MSEKITIILVDDHILVRAGIRSLLESIANVEVIKESGDGIEALSLLRTHQPTLLILDISLPGLNGLEVARSVTKMKTKTKILMLSMHSDVEYVAKALTIGSHGYLMKESAVEELETAISTLINDKQYIGKNIDLEMVDKLRGDSNQESDLIKLLTSRQRQILQLIAEGYSTREIAERMSVSIKTVETHRAHIMSRLNIFDIAGLVRFAIRCKLICLNEAPIS
ncbi:two component transcriptional regulator, LuxR family [Shewanella halifaxensis HAW-EB4]|uniref:Two component transcriptional regulator, LuxR family n=1 Tax=Shewanella halifaxensis (strain HAW-EB4) TaxID=458817 RepID=B0TSG4_SHEHH|nr:response regulator transcription factor [Shewanella halifaxensis]ABZ76544.1 two component transcriptional regulator, LuxR family [Shewanella halifaxensis HAW-EB4]